MKKNLIFAAFLFVTATANASPPIIQGVAAGIEVAGETAVGIAACLLEANCSRDAQIASENLQMARQNSQMTDQQVVRAQKKIEIVDRLTKSGAITQPEAAILLNTTAQ